MKIIKRNGAEEVFDIKKIVIAVTKADSSSEGRSLTDSQIEDIAEFVEFKCNKLNRAVSVEEIQDLVEEKLIEHGYAKTAKAYILYRAEHTKVRKTEADLVNIYRELTFTSAADADIKRENANIDADTSMGTMLKYGSEGANYFVDNYI